MTFELSPNSSNSSKQQQTTVKIPSGSTSSRMGTIAAIVFTALLTSSLISSTTTLGDDAANRIIPYLQISSLFAIFFSILGFRNAPQSEPSQKEGKSSYPQAIASRIEKREKLMHDSYKQGFRNLVSLLIFPDMSLEEAEFLLHLIGVMEPEKRKVAISLLRGPLSSVITRDNSYAFLQMILSNEIPTPEAIKALKVQNGAKITGCPFQHIWKLPTFSNDPLAMQEALKLHRFEEKVFKNSNSHESNPTTFLQRTSILACPPSDTPRYRKIFIDLVLKKKREKILQSIIQDHFDPLFETISCEPQDSIDHLLEEPCYDDLQDPFNLISSLNDSLQKIAGSILDEIPMDWNGRPPALNLAKLSESQLYQDLLDTGYTHEEIVINLGILAGIIQENGKEFLSKLLVHLQTYSLETEELLMKIKQDLQRQLESGKDIWDAIKEVKEIDMIILESLRMSESLPPMARTMLDSDKTIEILPDRLAKRSDLVGEKPEEFRPTRMVEGTDKQFSHYWPSSVSWMPFGHGKHLCPAWGLYQMMSRYVLAKISLSNSI